MAEREYYLIGNEREGYRVLNGPAPGGTAWHYPNDMSGKASADAQCKLLNSQIEQSKQNAKMQKQMEEQAKNADELNKKHEREERKRNKEDNSQRNGKGRLHGLYCLLIGWWLSMFLICCIVPLFFPGGRRLIKKAFGIW